MQPERRLQAGGTLNPSRHIYIERPQDAELLRLLLDREYSNVLTPRQMGKSSLMARTALELAARGVRFAAVDLGGELGSPDEAEPWYLGLLEKIARDLKLDLDVQAWWDAPAAETKNQKLLRFFREEVAGRTDGPVVIFLDEIDATLKLPYTDDLFTALRTMYNERPFVPAYERITVCLLGVATPNELIKHRRTTPYNIGRTVPLRDFNEAEDDLSPLARALSGDAEIGRAILSRVLHWAGGHPYLTVKLCEELVRAEARNPGDVDAYVERAFADLDRLNADVHFQDLLRFLTTRISDQLATLHLYEQVLQGTRERDQADLAHAQLKLSGLVKRDEAGCLVVRNRLYQHLFGVRWIHTAKPKPALRWAPVAALLGLLLIVGALALSVQAPTQPGLRPAPLALLPGRAIDRRMAPGEVHPYRVDLEAGQFLRIVVEQRGIDLVVTLFDPHNRKLFRVDSSIGPHGPEQVAALAEVSGTYRLELKTLDAKAPSGLYQVRVESLRAATDVDQELVRAMRSLAEARELRRRMLLSAAVTQLEVTLEMFQALGDFSGQGEVLEELGTAYRQMGRNEDAVAVYKRALPLSGQEAGTLFRLGETLASMSELPEALESLLRARRLWLSLGDRRQAAQAARSIGAIYSRRGNTQEALSSYELALAEFLEAQNLLGSAATLRSRAELYLSLGDIERASVDLNRALEIYREAGDLRGEAATLSVLGHAYTSVGSLERAFQYSQRALEIAQRVGDRRGVTYGLLNLGVVCEKGGDTTCARQAYEQALSLSRELGDRRVEARILNNLGNVNNYRGQALEALEVYRQALALWSEIGDDPSGEANALLGMAQAEQKRGNLSAARAFGERALETIESLRIEVRHDDPWASYFATQPRIFDFSVDLLMEKGEPAEALAVAERSRARSILEALGESRIHVRGELDPELGRRQRELESRISANEAQHRRSIEGDRREEAERLERELRVLELEYRGLLAQIRETSPRYAALNKPTPLSVGEIQTSVLDRETLLLEYRLGEERSFLWAVTPSTLHSFVLPRRAEVEEAAWQAYTFLSKPHLREQQVETQAVAALSRMLLSPVSSLLGRKRLLIVADGALNNIPFGALYSPATSSSLLVPLVTRHEIVNIPSVSAFAARRREQAGRPPAPGALAVVANPTFNRQADRLSPLPFSEREAQSILSLVPSGERLMATGTSADRETVFSGDLARYRIVHFATHAILNSRQPELSALVLSQIDEQGQPQDGLLRSYEIASLNLPTELVVLSAGNTALAKEVRWQAPTGMSQAFLYAGAKRVVASLWEIDDRATSDLMVRFYREMLQGGRRPAEALRLAQIAMLGEERWQHPYYWAGFVFQGEWR